MKTAKLIIAAIIAVLISANSFAQSHDHSKMAVQKTETLKVWGNCESCKDRIEKAAKTEGVNSAEWNKDTKILTLTFDPAKTNIDAIQKKIAAVGHDTPKFKADDKVYNNLPGCCKYERKE